jgi:hypothetical protein
MPIIPTGTATVSVSPPKLSGPPENPFLQIAERVIDINARISSAYEESEATRIAGEASANLAGAVKIADKQYGDPDEFGAAADKGVRGVYDNALSSSGNARIRAKVQAKLADNYNLARNNLALDVIRKKHDITTGNWEVQKDAAIKEFAQLDDAGKETKLTEMRAETAKLVSAGVLTHMQGAKDLVDLQNKAWREDAALFASREPYQFYKSVEEGRYTGRLSGSDLQTALDIADRTVRGQEAREARVTANSAKLEEQNFYADAKAKRLNEDDLAAKAALYGWSEARTNAILRVQRGLRESNPNTELLIREASRVEDPIYPTPQMVLDAQKRMEKLVESGKVSPDSAEYRSQMDNLRSLGNSAKRTDSTEFHKKAAAKTEIRDFLSAKIPDMDAEEKRKILGEAFNEINKLQGIDGLRDIIQRFEKRVTDRKTVVDPSLDAARRLRSTGR